MKKGFFGILLAALMILVLLPSAAFAEDPPALSEVFYTDADGSNPSAEPTGKAFSFIVISVSPYEASVSTADNSVSGTVSIPATVSYKGVSLTVTKLRSWRQCENIESLVIPNTVTCIPSSCFDQCTALKNVTIPESVTSIDQSAFQYCGALSSIALPSKLASIGEKAFLVCESLSEITIPSGTETIGFAAFAGCTGLSKVVVKAAVPPALDTKAFDFCSDDLKIYVPAGTVDAYKSAWSEYADRIYGPQTLTGSANGLSSGGVTFTVNGSAATSAYYGDSVTATAVSADGYTATLSGSDVTLASDGSFTMPDKAVTVTASYLTTGDFYVSSSGSDTTGSGSRDFPFATATHAFAMAGTAEKKVILLSDVTCGCFALAEGQNITLDLNGHTITINEGSTSSIPKNTTMVIDDSAGGGSFINPKGRVIENLGSLTLKGGTITGSTEGYNSSWVGAGVYNTGTFTMTGGSISNCKCAGDGGGVYNKGTFTMSGGSISSNTASSSGGGVCNEGTFTLSDGSISGNTSSRYGGGVYNDFNFTMTGGSISGNTASSSGGGVYNSLFFTMTGGSISNCKCAGDGGGVCSIHEFTMTGGSISGNTSSKYGGGICNRGDFTLSGGSITGNTAANDGGGAYIYVGTFTMSGGTISDNTSSSGGGVRLDGNLTVFTMSGGEISGNTASGSGGGLISGVGTIPDLGGTAKITGNTLSTDSSANDVYLLQPDPLVALLDGKDAPAAGMSVGIKMEMPGVFTFQAADGYKDYFFSDDSAYGVTYTSDKRLQLAPAYTITVTAPTNGTVTADLARACAGDTVTLTVTPATGYQLKSLTVKDASDNSVTVTDNKFTMPSSAVTVTAVFEPCTYTVTYKDRGDAAFSGTHESGYPTSHTYGTATTLKSATKDYYDFGGWFAASDCSGSAVTSLGAAAYTADITLYAKWTPTEYTVTLASAENGTVTADKAKAVKGDTVTLTVTPATGYQLKSLTVKDAGKNTVTVTDNTFTMPGANVTVTAVFEPCKYTITYKDQGGENFSGKHKFGYPTTHTYGTATELKGATQSGCTFDGWFTTSDCTGAAVTSLGATDYTADITLYAKWTHNYKIITGAYSFWTKQSGTGCLITSDAPFSKFAGVRVDGNTISATNYTAVEGSTKITLKPAYLNTLTVGKHSIEIVSTDGSASSYFYIRNYNSKYPATGDSNRPGLLLALVLGSGAALAGVVVYGKKKQKKS